MAFGSTALFDNHFNIAHFTKIVAYFVPFCGITLDYIQNYYNQKITVQLLAYEVDGRKKTERKLKIFSKKLKESNEELQNFAYIASHDLQEPLRMVTSYMQLISRRYKGQLDKDADEFIAFAADGASRMQRMINDLLEYSRVESQGRKFSAIDCTEVLQQALYNLQVSIEKSEAMITYHDLPTITADEQQMIRLFQNLIGNAIKFRGKNQPIIRINAEQKNNFWQFSVQDNSIGIDPNHSNKIFLIFQRLHNVSKYQGTGIGLAVCKKIVERHGGQIWIESEVGQGTTFYFTIPINGGKKT